MAAPAWGGRDAAQLIGKIPACIAGAAHAVERQEHLDRLTGDRAAMWRAHKNRTNWRPDQRAVEAGARRD